MSGQIIGIFFTTKLDYRRNKSNYETKNSAHLLKRYKDFLLKFSYNHSFVSVFRSIGNLSTSKQRKIFALFLYIERSRLYVL